MTRWLEGRRALVVGAGSGIGRAVVDAFLEEGASVAALDRDPGKAARLRRERSQVPVTVGDATTQEANAAAVQTTVERFGGLDVLVQCVGVFDFYRSIVDIEPGALVDAFDEVFHTNVLSHLRSVQAALPALSTARSPVVLLTESTSSYYAGRGGALYVASKFAVRGLVTALAHDLAPEIRVAGVAPGGTLGTDLRGVDALGSGDQRLANTRGREDDLASRTPLRVALSGADHAAAYVFLASERARGITGATVHSDGGMSVAAPRKRA